MDFGVFQVGVLPALFRSAPPIKLLVPPCSPPSSVEIGRVLAHEVVALLQKEAIERVHDSLSPGFYGRLFVVPKTTGGWRPVLDLSPLNVFLKKCPFRMDTLVSVRDAVRVGDWATSIDLSDAYFHILIRSPFRKWLRFVWNGEVFQFRALPLRSKPGCSHQSLPRRLAHLGKFQAPVPGSHQSSAGCVPLPRISDQRSEIGPLPFSDLHLPGHGLRHDLVLSPSFTSSSTQTSRQFAQERVPTPFFVLAGPSLRTIGTL